MKLPYAEHCYVAQEKITLYLLNLSHPKGGTKAVFFMAFGFIIENGMSWQEHYKNMP